MILAIFILCLVNTIISIGSIFDNDHTNRDILEGFIFSWIFFIVPILVLSTILLFK